MCWAMFFDGPKTSKAACPRSINEIMLVSSIVQGKIKKFFWIAYYKTVEYNELAKIFRIKLPKIDLD